MSREHLGPQGRMLNHAEFVYAPGERALARRLFEGLGCKVIDPQTDPVPEALGPAAGPYLIVFLDPDNEDVFDNVLYLSEVLPQQWEFEQHLASVFEADSDLARERDELLGKYQSLPQAMTHLGLAFPSEAAVETAIETLSSDTALAGRLEISPLYRPRAPGSVDDRVVQAFVRTDLCTSGLLSIGQQFELQVRVDGPA